MSNPFTKSDSAFHTLLREQIRHEFTASQQYIAIAVYFDSSRLPQLARRFYTQASEERGHALMMVQYLLDRDLPVEVSGMDEVTSTFDSVSGAVELALNMEKDVTAKITALSRSARETGDYLGERFMQWFLQEQVEEIASMTTLLTVIDRAAGNTFDIEEYVARESSTTTSAGAAAPKAAGGGV
ncbi:ferritin [Antrihabitans cavernicola]|uniref:Ferritin n=1 Tax=Antrihabitans cavernicola TaxID=2495913 RepID=A0A5A7SFY6_9NOCA|nr:ferritin [Spelaeibacter cavernicola]KAA0024736.1 ferritin [Spelaeibacter cavernicola]